MIRSRQRASSQVASCSAVVLVAVVIMGNHLVRCQFLQPQSHLGRLVQSIASPLVLSSSLGSGEQSDSYDGPEYGSAQSRPDEQQQHHHHHQQQYSQHQNQYQPEAGQHYQHYQRQPDYSRQRGSQQATAGLEQAPSQQRGIPQRYYGGGGGGGPQEDEDSTAPTNYRQQQPAANEQYQMGAYLGPSIDDKEIQGAFNSNDDRDDDDAPGYDGPPRGAGGRHADRPTYAASQPEGAGGYGMQPAQHGGSGAEGSRFAQRGRGEERANFDDESSADEDDEPTPSRQPRFRTSMNQAASQYHQRHSNRHPSSQSDQQGQSAPMMAAANGYSPMGSGPFDLSSLMAAAAGGANNGQAYEVYNGDGSYPGYYPQQQQQGRRNQAASMNNPYGYGQNGQQMGRYGPNQNGQRGGDNDDADADADED